jgi:arsenite methyltransferase
MSPTSLAQDVAQLAYCYEDGSVEREFEAGGILLERLALRAGERVLGVGNGNALLAKYMARVVGPRGTMVASGPLPSLTNSDDRRTNVDPKFREGTASGLGTYADASFDIVFLNAVSHWPAQKPGPLPEFHRLLAAGGRLGILIAADERFSTLHAIRQAVLARAPYVRFSELRCRPAERMTMVGLQSLLQQTGFAVSSLEVAPDRTIEPSPSAAIESAEASSFGSFLGHLPDDLRGAARAEIERELQAFRVPEGVRLESARVIAVAHRLSG